MIINKINPIHYFLRFPYLADHLLNLDYLVIVHYFDNRHYYLSKYTRYFFYDQPITGHLQNQFRKVQFDFLDTRSYDYYEQLYLMLISICIDVVATITDIDVN